MLGERRIKTPNRERELSQDKSTLVHTHTHSQSERERGVLRGETQRIEKTNQPIGQRHWDELGRHICTSTRRVSGTHTHTQAHSYYHSHHLDKSVPKRFIPTTNKPGKRTYRETSLINYREEDLLHCHRNILCVFVHFVGEDLEENITLFYYQAQD